MSFRRAAAAAIALAIIVSTQLVETQRRPSQPSPRSFLYASVGADLTQYDLDGDTGTLTKRATIALPANVQEAVLQPSGQHLYVAWSNSGASYGAAATNAPGNHGITAFKLDTATGALTIDGRPAPLRARPIYITTDHDGSHVIAAYNDPSGITVHRVQADGTIGSEVAQAADLDGGIYGHNVRVLPSDRAVVMVTRGNGPTARTAEDPGALKVFSYEHGTLKNRASIAPAGGYGFQARHIDFHPSRPFAFLTLERQNMIDVFRVEADSLSTAPLFSTTTLAEPGNIRPGQTASSIHVHPNGRFVYVGNRASSTLEVNGTRVAAGGENTIAVFAINQESGEPKLIQTIDTRGYHPRTFALDGAGRVLVVGNQSPMSVREGNAVRQVPASLAVFRIGSDGKLEFLRKYDVETDPAAGRLLFWTAIVSPQ